MRWLRLEWLVVATRVVGALFAEEQESESCLLHQLRDLSSLVLLYEHDGPRDENV